MKKKILVFVLFLFFALLFTVKINNVVVKADDIDLSTFTVWTETNSLPTSGNYYLANDVTLDDPSATRYINSSNELNLDLKGHTITHYGNNSMAYYCVYYVNGGTISIYDSVGDGKITGCGMCCIWVGSGTFNLYGGTITGNDFNSTNLNERGGIYLDNGGVANIYGGAVINNGNGNRDLGSYGTVNFYGGHVGKVIIYLYGDDVSINGGCANILTIDEINTGKVFKIQNGKLAEGSTVTLSLYDEEEVITSGYTTSGYTDPNEFFIYAAKSEGYEMEGIIENDEIKVRKKQAHVHSSEYFPANEATCEVDGNYEYYYCSDCGKYFTDSLMTNEVSYDDLVIEKTGHHGIHVDKKDPTCALEGCLEHYECEDCHKVFSDAELNNEITLDSIKLERTEHTPKAPTYYWNDDCTECYAELRCGECGQGITAEVFTTEINTQNKKIEATFTKDVFTTQVIDNPYYEGGNSNNEGVCGMHFVLLVFTLLFVGFYACWYTVLNDKEFKFLPAKISKKLVPLFVCGLMLLLVLIFGIIGMAKSCGACIAFFIIDILLIGCGVALYFFDDIVIGFIQKLFKKEKKSEE